MTSFPEHLTDEERSRICVNHCVRESELVAARAFCAAAEPGELWARSSVRIPDKPEALAFLLDAVRLVPRLLGGIAVLEKALRHAWLDAASLRRELSAERNAHAETMKRQMEGKTEQDAETAELRRQLREAIEKVARGEVPEVLQPAVREAKKRAKSGE